MIGATKHKLDIVELTKSARYSDVLSELINDLKGDKVLFLSYESDYQGDVDIDVLLEDGRVFSYHYWYGSCSGCDDWEDQELSDEQIKEQMKTEATFFDAEWQWREWCERAAARLKKSDDDT